MGDALGKLGMIAVGGIIVALAIGNCVLPLLQDRSDTVDCDAPGMDANCDDPGSVANFFVRLCGRDAVALDGSPLAVTLRQGPYGTYGAEEHGARMVLRCDDDVMLTLEWDDDRAVKDVADLYDAAATPRDRQVLEVWEDWSAERISFATARTRIERIIPGSVLHR